MCINKYWNNYKESNRKHLCDDGGHVSGKINVLLQYCYLVTLSNH